MTMLVDTVFNYTQLDDPSRMAKAPCAIANTVNAATGNLRS